ncbi:MAG: sugar phosphate isomerase/epimerase [Bacteroidetes bacterium]|nr:sugar phosphate isomerase/epimerase [Bacteroidota bacterium]MBS1541373.1 sugar phosphate isomerase/epimerase [Bacteroidota bacterium]
MNRRTFVKRTGTAAVAATFLPHLSFSSVTATRPLGLQLYTLMGIIDSDLDGTLKKLSDLGYTELESAFSMKGGFYGLKAKEFAAKAKSFGLNWRAHHVIGAPFKLPPGAKLPTGKDGKPITIPAMKNLKENREEIVESVAESGIKYLVCASTPLATHEEIDSSIEVLNKTHELCQKAGLGLLYHNHDFEFKVIEGKVPYTRLLTQLHPEIKFELDLAWVTKAGVDPVSLFKLYPGRFPTWHVKDIDAEFKKLLPVGQGVVNFKRIFEYADVAGLEFPFVEHDQPADAFASLSSSMAYLKELLK